MHSKRLLHLILIAAGFLRPCAALAQPEPIRLDLTPKDIEASLDDEWLGLYFQGTKIGYVNSKRTKEKEEFVVKDKVEALHFYREKLVMSMKLQSAGQKSELKIEQTLDF